MFWGGSGVERQKNHYIAVASQDFFYEENKLIRAVEQTGIYLNSYHAPFFAFSCNFECSICCKTDYGF